MALTRWAPVPYWGFDMIRPFIETRTTALLEKPRDQIGPPTPEQRQHWVQTTLASNRLPLVTDWRPRGADLNARVNQGRWIADCPTCLGAEFADSAWPVFVCCSCGEGPRAVVFPPERELLEPELIARPLEARNWVPGETVAQLRAENAERGIA